MVRLLSSPFALALTAFAVLPCTACDSNSSTPTEHPFVLHASNGQAEALPGVIVKLGSSVLGSTQKDGTLPLQLSGVDGQRILLQVACPKDYRAPKEPLSVALFHYVSGAIPEITVRCEAAHVTQGVVIRTAGAHDIPIVVRGRRVTATDAVGVAHVLVAGEPGEHVDLLFDTSGLPELRPANPTVAVVLGNHDDASLAVQRFETKTKPKKRTVSSGRPKVTGPIRIH